MLPRAGQLPVRAREQRVGPRSAPQVQHDGTIRPRASPGAAVRGLRDLLSLSRPTCHSFFTGPVFFLVGAFSPTIPARMAGENSFLHGFALKKCYYCRVYMYVRPGVISRFARFFAWHDMNFAWFCIA